MILRLGPLLLLVVMLYGGTLLQTAAAQTPIPPVTVDVEGITVALAPADADAFQRRLNQPPLLDGPPVATGLSYTVTTAYWDAAVRETDAEPDVEPEAEYFPVGGFVRTLQDGQDVWLVLDLRQRAILDRYIRFVIEAGRPGPRPGALEITLFASQTETVGIEAGNRRLGEDEARAVRDALAAIAADPTFRDSPQPPETTGVTGYWLTFALPEGRSLQYLVDTRAGLLSDSLGTETYDVGGIIGGALPESVGVSLIEHDDPAAGSQLWWVVAVGGGAALVAIAAWLQRRTARSV